MNLCLDGSIIRAPMSGVQFSVRQEILSLRAPLAGERVLVCCRDPVLEAGARAAGWEILRPPAWAERPAGRVLWQQLALPGVLKRKKMDLLHALAYTAPHRCPVPCVVNIHDLIALEHPELCAAWNRLHMRTLMPASIRRAASCIVSTRAVAEQLRARFELPEARIAVIPLGVELERFARQSVLPASIRREIGPGQFLLFVGNIEPKKGLDTLLDAYAATAASHDLALVLAGRRAWKSADLIERIRSWTGPGRVCRLGRVPDEVLPALYRHALMLIMPSVVEGFGLPVLEAMAAGTPVVHSDHPALVEAAGGAGISFPVGDARELAAAMVRLIECEPLRIRLAAAGRQHAASRPWSCWGEQVAGVLRAAARRQ